MLFFTLIVAIATFLQLFNCNVSAADYSFVSIGDWGGAQLGGQYTINVNAVASQMATTASDYAAKFVINTGDNFYWCGIQNTTDPQIQTDFLTPYMGYASLNSVKWYSALGNHEYGYNVQAQIDYTQKSSTWFMPARYYTTRLQLSGSNYATLLFLDTSPCYQDYRSSNPENWDPCMTQYPTCSQQNNDDDFEGPCLFNENILSQDCSVQYNWLKTTLQGIPTTDWLIVVGHHPIDETDVKDLTSLLQQRGFALYINGHAHYLNQYTIDGAGAYITSGAGAMVDTVDQKHPLTYAKVHNLPVDKELYKSMGKSTTGHSYSTVWYNKIAGFTLHTFNSAFTELTTTFLDYNGNNLHSFVVNQSGKIIS